GASAAIAASDAIRDLRIGAPIAIDTCELDPASEGAYEQAVQRCRQLLARVENGGVAVSAATRAVARGAIETDPEWSTDQLPRSITTFVGRQEERDAVCELVRQQRLVTLIGPAGCGKTRLAIEAARSLRTSFDRASYIELAPVRRGDDVATTLAQAMGLAQPDDAALLDAIVSGIGDSE